MIDVCPSSSSSFSIENKIRITTEKNINLKWKKNCQRYLWKKGNDFRASGLGQVRRLTAATAAITLACLFVYMLCYVMGRLHSSCLLSTRIGLHITEVLNKTLVNSEQNLNLLFSYQNKNL